MDNSLEKFSPPFQADQYSPEDQWHLAPFFTNLRNSVYVPLIFSPELIGALCSRTSRATKDLRHIYLQEYIYPFINPIRGERDTDETWQSKVAYGKELRLFLEFLHEHPFTDIFSNPRARSFYVTWLAQYGDDSIAQMAGMHLVFSSLSQIAIKHAEDQRIGLAPIEKSTRYVDYSQKVNGRYLYYTDPTLRDLGLVEEYERAMDCLFEAYTALIPRLTAWFTERFPEEKPAVIEKKAFDTLRGLLPVSTLSQVAFFGNGQAFEHLINRSRGHSLGEIRWLAAESERELNKLAPAFFRRLQDPEKKELLAEYHQYLGKKGERVVSHVKEIFGEEPAVINEPRVELVEHDVDGEEKVITGILFSAPNNHRPWKEILSRVHQLSPKERAAILDAYLKGRTRRFQKVGRAFENANVRFEIVMNIGAWRDLHRHRMLTQQRQNFSCYHGYDVPPEIVDSGLEQEFRGAIAPVEAVFAKIAKINPDLAQYAVTMAHRVRFIQWQNLREVFWETELRTIPEGHPDYRRIEQMKFRELQKMYPLIAERMMVNMGEYDFARRGQEEKIQKKMQRLL